jgi:hypothetical protein
MNEVFWKPITSISFSDIDVNVFFVNRNDTIGNSLEGGQSCNTVATVVVRGCVWLAVTLECSKTK